MSGKCNCHMSQAFYLHLSVNHSRRSVFQIPHFDWDSLLASFLNAGWTSWSTASTTGVSWTVFWTRASWSTTPPPPPWARRTPSPPAPRSPCRLSPYVRWRSVRSWRRTTAPTSTLDGFWKSANSMERTSPILTCQPTWNFIISAEMTKALLVLPLPINECQRGLYTSCMLDKSYL